VTRPSSALARGDSREALISGEADLSATFSSLASSASHRAPGFLEMSVIQSRPRSRTAASRPNSALSANLDGIEDVDEDLDLDVEGEEVLPDASFFSGRSTNQDFTPIMHHKTTNHLSTDFLELNLESYIMARHPPWHSRVLSSVCMYVCMYIYICVCVCVVMVHMPVPLKLSRVHLRKTALRESHSLILKSLNLHTSGTIASTFNIPLQSQKSTTPSSMCSSAARGRGVEGLRPRCLRETVFRS
jgi:hypothetical protein